MPHVLLCDDELHILRAAEFKLSRAGYEVQCAGDGQEGWEAIQRRKPDILVTDLQMPQHERLPACSEGARPRPKRATCRSSCSRARAMS